MNTCLKSILSAILFIAITSSSFAQTDDDVLQRLINNQDYFGLSKELKKPNLNVSEHTLLMAKAYAGYYFNRPQEAIESIEKLKKDHQDKIGRNFGLNILLAECYAQAGQYTKAAELYGEFIERIKQWINPDEQGYTAILNRYKALSNTPPQKMVLNTTTSIPVKNDALGLITVPVTINNKTQDFVFNTSAGSSAISEANAKQMGLKMLNAEIQGFDESNNETVNMKLAIAEKMKIGEVEFENILFLVKPGELTEKDAPNYKANGIIGLNVMLIMGQIEYNKNNNTITIVKNPGKYDLPNLMVNNMQLYVQALSGNNILLMTLDTKTLKTTMTSRYHHRYGLDYDKTAGHGELKLGKFGLSKETTPVRIIKDFPLQVGNTKKIIPEMYINTETINKVYNIDGTLGLDYIKLFDKMIINFNDMYITFE